MLQETSIFFSGAKLFQSTKSNLKVTIVDFASFGCMELIVYDPVQKMEAPRIYLNKNLWNSKIKQNEVNKKMAIEIEFLNRKRQKFDKEQLLLKTIYKLTVKYIISRLNYGKCLKEGEFRVELTPGFTDLIDKSTHKLDIVQMRPIELTPFAIKHEDDEGEDADNEEQTECEKEGDGLGHGLHIVTNSKNTIPTKQQHTNDEKHEKHEKSVRKQHRAHSIMNNYTIFMDEEVMQGSGVADLGGVVHTGINTISEVDASTALDGSKHAAGGNKMRTKRMSVARRNSVINFVHNGESELAQLFDALTLEKGGLKSHAGSRAASPISSPMIFRVGSKDAVNNISPGKTTDNNKINSNSPNNTNTFDNQTSKQAATAAAKAFGLHTNTNNTNTNTNSNNTENDGSEDGDSSVSSYDSGTEVPDKFVRHVNRKSLMAAKYDSNGHLVAPQMTAQQIAQLENQKLLDDLYHENNKHDHSNGKKKSPTTAQQQQQHSPKNNANLLPTLHTNHPRSPLKARLPNAK